MTRHLLVHRAGPSMSLQDLGRPGYLAYGLARGGAADRLALIEGACLLSQSQELAALEMAGVGGAFEASEPMRIALTGAPMRAHVESQTTRQSLAWNASHLLQPGQRLVIAAATRGCYGYLHVGGGFSTPLLLGGRAAHLAAGLGQLVANAAQLPVAADPGGPTGQKLPDEARFDGGLVRVLPSLQTPLFPASEIERFQATSFKRDTRGNRMGVRILPDGDGFGLAASLKVLSETIVPGDIQITGDGTPYVLLSECQTTGGYPRIGCVLPADLPKVAQAQPGGKLRFEFVSLEEAVQLEAREQRRRDGLARQRHPLTRDPRCIPNLLAYQLISGATAGDD